MKLVLDSTPVAGLAVRDRQAPAWLLRCEFSSIWPQKVAGATRENVPREDPGNEDKTEENLTFPWIARRV